MLFSLALKNIKKSIKDYSIYFFTLVVAVAIFYVFNSLDSQESALVMSESKYQIVQSLVRMLSYLSVFISFILGFLIIYSNNFLVKRRKKEFGLYLTLGMSKKHVSTILVIETLLVGLISLGIGLLLGIFLSQFLSLFTAKLFEADMDKFKFIFSIGALVKSIIYFGIIFIFVMIFNVISISRNRLINLLNANRKNEKVRIRNKYLIIITMILSALLLGYAYYNLFNGVLLEYNKKVIYMLITGALGTLLFFFSISGLLLKLFQLNKKIYFKNLNMFVLKQINNKINSSVISTTIISLMLLLTIGILSGSMSMANVYNSDVKSNNRTDFTIYEYSNSCTFDELGNCITNTDVVDLTPILQRNYFKDTVKEYINYNTYTNPDITMDKIIDNKTKKEIYKEYGDNIQLNASLYIISESDYNNIIDLYNESDLKIDLNDNQYLLTSNLDTAYDFYKSFYQDNGKIKFNGKTLSPISNEIIKIAFSNYPSSSNYGTIILDDSLMKDLDIYNTSIIGNYKKTNDIEKLDNNFISEIENEEIPISINTKIKMQESNIGIKAIMTFVGLYLGIIFAISSATVLAIGQLSESSDNKSRYKVLRQLGANNKMIKTSLFTQIGIAFGFPLVVAIIHSIFGLREINNIIKTVGNLDLASNIFLTSLFIVILYGGYFMITYISSKNIINKE